MAGDFDRQVAGMQVRAAILNRFTQLGTPTTDCSGDHAVIPPGVWGFTTTADFCNKATLRAVT